MTKQPQYSEQGYLKRKDGAIFKKYQSTNPISLYLINGFKNSLLEFVQRADPQTIHEIGCGEGKLSELLAANTNAEIRATDYDENCILHAIHHRKKNIEYEVRNVYKLTQEHDSAELIVCCEVLEHLEYPEKALKVINTLNAKNYIFSVPREPLWRVLNILRGKYWKDLGNTPTHINHWSRKSFIKFISTHFEIIALSKPIPWTMVICKKK